MTELDDEWYRRPVRLIDKPGKRGIATGRVMRGSGGFLVEIDFGPGEVVFKPADLIEPVEPTPPCPREYVAKGKFGHPRDLRDLLTLEKLRGHRTDIFYSMESSNTEFYPHQFKPVLRFVESVAGRLLIADEVGLGKTIEAIYIWKELQAREGAQRLLVVCPAMLRDKWRRDLRQRFGIDADVLSAEQFVERLEEVVEGRRSPAWVVVASLEGLRPDRDWDDGENTSARAMVARLLDRAAASGEPPLDLVVIDEAHSLRNPETLSHRLGRMLRDASRHFLLLTATPIHLGSANLFHLLRLIDPEVFEREQVFDEMLHANAPVIEALRAVWSYPADSVRALEAVRQALSSPFFARSPALQQVAERLETQQQVGPQERVELAAQLESASLLSPYLVRSRKREVTPGRIIRDPHVKSVRFTDLERTVYEMLTVTLRRRLKGLTGATIFTEIARQRRMASSLPAALRMWSASGQLDELLWEDFGFEVPEDAVGEEVMPPLPPGLDLASLEAADSKYRVLRDFLREVLIQKPAEKVVIFSFFRGTVQYLCERLARDGIRADLLWGGMGAEAEEVLARFREPEGPNVLVSTEVGTEGIDLEFCRVLINYDLPWNPMKVEQRIGRLDRLGQTADRILIASLVVEDTIDDRILYRLYQRIRVFEESLGELEEILGRETQALLVDLYTRELTEAELERRADQIAMAIEHERQSQETLENHAIHLVAWADYLLEKVTEARDQGRWLQPEEVRWFVEDILMRRYPGSTLQQVEPGSSAIWLLRLAEPARQDLLRFMGTYRGGRTTQLHQTGEIRCTFDPRRAGQLHRRIEVMDYSHPVVRWLVEIVQQDPHPFFPTSAGRVPHSEAGVATGWYAYAIAQLEFRGLRRENRLLHRAAAISADVLLSPADSERLISSLIKHGREAANVDAYLHLPGALDAVDRCIQACHQDYERARTWFISDNGSRCSAQEASVTRWHERRLTELRERVERLRSSNPRMVPATEGLIRSEEAQRARQLAEVRRRRHVDESLRFIAVGVVEVVADESLA